MLLFRLRSLLCTVDGEENALFSLSAPKPASKARDPVDAILRDVQSENGGVLGGRGLFVLL